MLKEAIFCSCDCMIVGFTYIPMQSEPFIYNYHIGACRGHYSSMVVGFTNVRKHKEHFTNPNS